jgi:DNA-binding GntR family transcriptional regulator
MDQYFKENDFERRRELDKQFHTAIIKLSGNLFFIYLLDALHSLIIPFIDDMIDLTLITSSEQIIFNDHKDILNALLNKDKVAFARAIDMHIYVDETHSETLKAKFAHWSLQ